MYASINLSRLVQVATKSPVRGDNLRTTSRIISALRHGCRREFAVLSPVRNFLNTNQICGHVVVPQCRSFAVASEAVVGQHKEILLYPHDTLRLKCKPVEDVSAQDVQQLVADLLETLDKDGRGIGLAAPQIGGTHRVFVMRTPKYRNEFEFKSTQASLRRKGRLALQKEQARPAEGVTVVINPRIIQSSPTVELGIESCLSVPDYSALVRRHARIEVSYMTEKGDTVHTQFHGAPAIVFQHEYDHLDGVLIVDREVSVTKLPLEEEMEIAREKWQLELMKYYGGAEDVLDLE